MPPYGRYIFFAPVKVYSDYEVTAYDSLILVTTGDADKTITLPKANSHQGKLLIVAKVDSGPGYVNIWAQSGDTIDGQSYIQLRTQKALCYILSFGNNEWFSNILQATTPYFPTNADASVNSITTQSFLDNLGATNLSYVTITSSAPAGNYTTYFVNCASGDVVLTLPSASTRPRRIYNIMRVANSPYNCIISPASGEKIGTENTISLDMAGQGITIQSDSSKWNIIWRC